MNLQSILVSAIIGIVAGWLASFVVGGGGLVAYLVSGIIGSFVGPWVLSALKINLGIANALISQIVTSAIGAIIVVLVARLIIR